MFKNIFGNYSSLAEILCMLVVAGIIGYLFHYLLSRKKWSLRINRLESKILNLEMKAREIEEIKDKQGLLFKNTKDMTLKINEFDALLGLTSEVDSISKTLNSLNFVSSKEFNQYAHEEAIKSEEFRQEVVGELSKSAELVGSKVDNATSGFSEQFNSFEERLNEFQKNNEVEMNSFVEKSALEFDKMYTEINSNAENSMSKYEERFSETQNELESLKIKFETQTWSSGIESLDKDLGVIRNELKDVKSNLAVVESLEAKIEKNSNVLNSYEDNLNNLNDNYGAVSKELDKFDQLDQKVKIHAKTILELSEMENSVVDMKKDLYEFSKTVDSNQNNILNFEKDHKKIQSEFTASNKEIRKDLASVTSSFNKLNQSVDSLEELFKVHKHEGPDFTEIEASISKLRNKQEDIYADYKKYSNEVSYLKGKLEQKTAQTKAPAKPKKRMKMADKLSIKGIQVTAKDKDDLKLIKGVGPMIEKKMNKLGIYCFEQVSNLSRSDIELITEAIEFFPGRIVRDDWRGQAKKLKRKKVS